MIMKAAIYKDYGSPDVVSVVQIETPKPNDNELLIKVHATTVNRTDCGFRSAEYFISRFFSGLFKPKYQVLGCEFAGEVVEIGKSVTLFAVGDRVFGFNDTKFGSHAEFIVLSENDSIAIIPSILDYFDAAAITEGAHYALCDIRAAGVVAGQKVLINGATGGIGSAAVQIVKSLGAEVTAVCDTRNVEMVKSIGADIVIDYFKDDFTKCNDQFDFVFDAVGKSTFAKCKPLLKNGGVYASTELGPGWQNPFLAIITQFVGNKKVLFPIPSINKLDVEYLKLLVENKKFKPVIDRVYNLDQIVEAYRYVETGQKIGNVIVKTT